LTGLPPNRTDPRCTSWATVAVDHLRIADYARPGEVLVSAAVAEASQEEGIEFLEIGQVELKGVSGTTHVLRAHRA
jgi:hypothetical protein